MTCLLLVVLPTPHSASPPSTSTPPSEDTISLQGPHSAQDDMMQSSGHWPSDTIRRASGEDESCFNSQMSLSRTHLFSYVCPSLPHTEMIMISRLGLVQLAEVSIGRKDKKCSDWPKTALNYITRQSSSSTALFSNYTIQCSELILVSILCNFGQLHGTLDDYCRQGLRNIQGSNQVRIRRHCS